MNTMQLIKLLKTYKDFQGVFPCDKIPKIKKKTFGVILNTDEAKKPGEHWVAFYVKNGKGENFDSFGLLPFNKKIANFVKLKSTKSFSWNKVQFQSKHSTTCGNHCVLFLACRFNGVTPKQFKNLFCKNSKTNDVLVYKLINLRNKQ